jgi:predicted transposase/invertase (TIGR01784 family)
MHYIELNKFKKDFKDIRTTLDRWVAFLNRAYEFDKDRIPEELAVDEAVKKAVEKLDVMYLDKEEREIYENDLKRLRDFIAEMKTVEKKKAIEIAKNLLDVLDDETIAIKTGLTIEEVNKLRSI